MPELPEVETTVRALRKPLIGRTITAVRNTWPRHLANLTLPEMQHRLHNQRIEAITRRAKYLVFHLHAQEILIIHLKMTGHLAVTDKNTPMDKHIHTVFELDNGQELRFRDTRKFGRINLVHRTDEIFADLGPEPLEDSFTVACLRLRLHGRKRALKPLLLDQSFIAGVGNIYADEALFYAKLHPERRADTLEDKEVVVLHTAVRHVLQLGIDREGASISDYIKPDGSKGDMQNAVNVFRRTEEPCYECGHPIQRIVLGGRSTHFCPNCQSS
jgi:formamidopyrimidine-DNA glycosylase